MKNFDTDYMDTLRVGSAARRYAEWLTGQKNWGHSIFEGMKRALAKADFEMMDDYDKNYPGEAELYRKHLENHPDALKIQQSLFNLTERNKP